MPLRNIKTGESLRSAIEAVLQSDFKLIAKSKEFDFDWEVEKENELYKIFLVNAEDEILGIMSLIDIPEEYRIHLNLIEIGKSNRGKGKVIDLIAGSLLAFGCRLSFARGYFGFLSLHPKTKLIELYQNKYGFRQYGRLLAVEEEASKALIQKYLPNE